MMQKNKDLPSASVIISFYNNSRTVEKVIARVLSQDYKKKEIIIINDCSKDDTLEKIRKFSKNKSVKVMNTKESLGLTRSLNEAIKMSKGEIIVTLLGDCYPLEEFWLSELVKPFEDPEVIASTATVRYPKWLWETFDPITKEITKTWVGDFHSGLDQKGVAYRKSALFKAGLFDEVRLRNFGEDFDMTIKLRKIGKTFNGTKGIIIHDDPYDIKRVIRISASYGKSFGLLFRIYGFSLHQLKGGLLRALFPIWAIAKFIRDHRHTKYKLKVSLVLLKMNWTYLINFSKGFLKKSMN